MSEYVITINSTSDLPKEWVWEREIPVVPLNCTIGGKTYRDMYDLTAEERRDGSDFTAKSADCNRYPGTDPEKRKRYFASELYIRT